MLLFPNKFRKIQPQALRLGIPYFFLFDCSFNCIKKPFCDVLDRQVGIPQSCPTIKDVAALYTILLTTAK